MGHHLPLNSNYPFVRTSISYYLQSSSELYTTGKLHLKKLNDLSMPAGRYMAEEKVYKAGLSCLVSVFVRSAILKLEWASWVPALIVSLPLNMWTVFVLYSYFSFHKWCFSEHHLFQVLWGKSGRVDVQKISTTWRCFRMWRWWNKEKWTDLCEITWLKKRKCRIQIYVTQRKMCVKLPG